MPALKLKTTGTKSTGTRKSTAKPATKRTAAKPAARKTAAKTTKATTKRAPRKAAADKEEVVDRRTALGKVDPAVLARYEDALIAVGDKMDEAQALRDEALSEAYEITQSALGDGVPMALVSDLTRISRQWLYNMGNHAGRGGSVTAGRRNGGAKKTTTGRKVATGRKAATTGRKTTGTKQAARKPAAKAAGTKKLTIKRK